MTAKASKMEDSTTSTINTIRRTTLKMTKRLLPVLLLSYLAFEQSIEVAADSSLGRQREQRQQRQRRRQQQQQEDVQLFDNCDVPEYYSMTNVTDRSQLHRLLQNTHRRVLPYTSSTGSVDDVWMALQDLDRGRVDDGDGTPMEIGDDDDTVRLIYAQRIVNAIPRGTASTWNREHLFPKSRGVGPTGPDFVDVHHLRPADVNVNSARSDKFFGLCGLFNPQSECRIPAHSDAPLTESDPTIFTPPSSVRGDIARAIMYMELRYDGDDGDGDGETDDDDDIDLILTDCPDQLLQRQQQQQQQQQSSSSQQPPVGIMAYKSVLLQWHIDDPPDEKEMIRNTRVCQRWQGNRNPFIDHPQLASTFYGLPSPMIPLAVIESSDVDVAVRDPFNCTLSPSSTTYEGTDSSASDTYTNCTATTTPTTTAPTTTTTRTSQASTCYSPPPTPSPQQQQPGQRPTPGDIMIIGVNSDDPDTVLLVSLVDLPQGLQLYMTDNAWTGRSNGSNGADGDTSTAQATVGGLRSNEGVLKFIVPDGGIDAGTVFGYGPTLKYGLEWQQVHGSFALSTNGDTVLIYAIYNDSDDDDDVSEDRAMNSNAITDKQTKSSGAGGQFLSALSFSGDWQGAGLEESSYGTQTSSLPTELIETDAVVTLDHQDNYIYSGPTTGTVEELRRFIQNSEYWTGSNTQRLFDLQMNDFTVESTSSNLIHMNDLSTDSESTSSNSIAFSCKYRRLVVYAWIISTFLHWDY